MPNLSQLNSRMDLGHAVVFAKNLLTPFWVPRRLSLFKDKAVDDTLSRMGWILKDTPGYGCLGFRNQEDGDHHKYYDP